MSKQEFLARLSDALPRLKRTERKRVLSYYSEMIDDRAEDGESEQDIIASLGSIDEITAGIIEDAASRGELKKNISVLAGVLIVVGSPVWLPLLVTALVLAVTFYALAWVLVAVMFSIVVSLAAAGISGIVGLFIYMSTNVSLAVFTFGVGLAGAGLCILSLFPSVEAAKWLVRGTGRAFRKTVGKIRRQAK
jgi:uncharacterized membrane protein